jgi:hypothetical protein
MNKTAETMDVLNANVTTAIMAAEEATYRAIVAWDAVKQAERAIAQHPDASELDKSIGISGVISAAHKIDAMSVLIGKHAGKYALGRKEAHEPSDG